MSYTFSTNLQSKGIKKDQIEALILQGIQATYSNINGENEISIPKEVPAKIYFAKLGKFLGCDVFYKKI